MHLNTPSLFFLSQTKPILLMYILQGLQEHFLGFHFLTLFLKIFKLPISSQSSGSSWYAEFTSSLKNSEIGLGLFRLLFFYVKISFRSGSARFLLTRNILIVRD